MFGVSMGFGVGGFGGVSTMQFGMQMGGVFSGGFMSSMGMFGGLSSMCVGMGAMTPFMGFPMMGGGMSMMGGGMSMMGGGMPMMGGGMPMMGGGMSMMGGQGMMNDPMMGGLFAQVAKNQSEMNRKCKTSFMGNLLGKVLGLAAGVGLAALVVGTGGMALPVLLAAGTIGAGVGGSLGFLLGGGGSLMSGQSQASSYARFM